MLPTEFTNRMQRLLAAEADAFFASYCLPPNVGLRHNPLKVTPMPPLPQFGLTPVPWAPHGFYYDPQTRPGLCAWHEAGVYYLQEPSAMAPAVLLQAAPGQRVLDLCAAPGGKSTQLAADMAGQGLLVCNEIHTGRAKILSRNVERMAIANALVLNETPQRLASRFPRYFDKILVDAPCSGEGMFRKEEAALAQWTPELPVQCALRQAEILDLAETMLRPGGQIVYSTCTFSPQENEGVISRFLHTHPGYRVLPVSGPHFSPGRPDWIDHPAPGVENAVRLWPHKLRGEGHFAALIQSPGQLPLPESVPGPGRDKLPSELDQFCRETGITLPEGNLLFFGQTLYWVPRICPDLAGLRVLRAGLELGQIKKGRLDPAHALALWLKTAARVQSFPADSREIAAYWHGETLPGSQAGWTLIQADGISLGWAKGSGGQLKNHFPKGLRRPY